MIIFFFLFNIYLPLQMCTNNIQCAICSHTVKWQEMHLPLILSKMVNIVKEILRPLHISLFPFLRTAKKAFLLLDDCRMLASILINTGIFPATCWGIWSTGHKLKRVVFLLFFTSIYLISPISWLCFTICSGQIRLIVLPCIPVTWGLVKQCKTHYPSWSKGALFRPLSYQ